MRGQSVSASDKQAKAKMHAVVTEALRLTVDPEERRLLEQATVFINIKDFEMSLVGVSVVIKAEGNKLLLSFTRDRFASRTVGELAIDLLEQLRDSRKQQP